MEPGNPLRRARSVRVESSHTVTLDVDLGFGVHVNRLAQLEGVSKSEIPYADRDRARHCLVVLLAKKKLLVRFADEDPDKVSIARLYLAEPVRSVDRAPWLTVVDGMDFPCMEISAFFLSLRDCGFSVQRVKDVLNGRSS